MWRPWSEDRESDQYQIDNDNCESATDNRNGCAKNIHLGLQAKQIVLNVYRNLQEENVEQTETNILNRTSKLTGVCYSTVYNIVKHGISDRKVRSDKGTIRKVSSWEVDIIRRTVYSMYKQGEVATLDSLQRNLQENTEIHASRTTIWRTLKQNGFRFGTIDKRRVIMESPRIQKLRQEYLIQMKKFRDEGRFICYVDETWYDTHDTVNKGWFDNSQECLLDVPSSRGKRIIILHAGSDSGWVGEVLLSSRNIKNCNLDYHEDMTAQLFEEWFQKSLLPVLSERSIIVMDNAPYHSRQVKKLPNSNSTKAEISDFLQKNDLYYEDSYTKNQLLEVLKTKTFQKEYVIDSMAIAAGHTVLRLPPYYCILNPIELIWSQLKDYVRRTNDRPKFSEVALNRIREAIANITPEKWKNCIRHTIDIEDTYLQYVNIHDEFIIDLNESDEDSTDDLEELQSV